jgi:hypothetical protein
MSLGHHQHQVLLEQEACHEVLAAHREVEDGQVELAVGQLRLESCRVALDDDEAELGMALGHGVHEAGDQPPGGGADHPHPDGAGDLVLAGGHVGHERVELRQDAPGPRHDDRALGGQAPVGPVDERGAELLLEAGHVGRDVGLDRAEVLGGGRERAVVTDGREGLEVPEFHRQ